jgi:hypothetical protein
VVPWQEPPLALAGLLAVIGVAFLFGSGWRALFATRASPTPGEPPAAPERPWLALIWMASYAAPAAVLARPGLPVWVQLAAVWSPVYAFLRLLPGLARGAELLPLWLALAVPAAIGLAMRAAAPRTRTPSAAAPARERKDPLEAYLRTRGQAWDNPVFSLALSRQARRPAGLTGTVLGCVAAFVLLPAVVMAAIFIPLAAAHGIPVLELLHHPAGKTGFNTGGLAGMVVAGFAVWFCMIATGPGLGVASVYESVLGKLQWQYFLIAPVEDRAIVLGTLASASLGLVALVAGCVSGALVWAGVALAFGAPWWWLPALLWALVANGALTLLSGLDGIRAWKRKRSVLYVLRSIVRVSVPTTAPLLVLVAGAIVAEVAPQLLRTGLSALPWLLVLLPVPLLLYVPLGFRNAIRDVGALRHDDMETLK